MSYFRSDKDTVAFCKDLIAYGVPITVGDCVSWYNTNVKNG